MRAEVPPHGQRKREQPKSVHSVKLDNCHLAMIVVHQHSLNRQPIVVSTIWVQEFGPSILFFVFVSGIHLWILLSSIFA